MSKKDLIRKIASRKFWALIAGMITAFLLLFGIDQGTTVKIVGAIGAFGSIIMYMFAEGQADVADIKNKTPFDE